MHPDFLSASKVTTTAPKRFHLNLTEVCSLRCRHCLTQAPQKTARREARSMSLSVLNVLLPWLHQARYLSLCHAGEPMLSPVFHPLLESLALNERPPRVHLMSNGLILDEERFVWLARHGVCSLVISVDGLSPETHDWLRVGSSIHKLERMLISLAAARSLHGLPVRLGISWTVHRKNVQELYALPDRARSWGIDAIKIEELVATGPETNSLGPVPDSLLAPALAYMRQRCRELDLVFVDHTVIRQVRRCQYRDSPELAEFIRGDDFINSDTIHFCRDPYDTVYVEPDGMLKPISFHHRGAGNVLETPLLELFNGEHFQAWRARVASARRCGVPPLCAGEPCELP